jgi:hypothetical protein
MLHSLRLAAVVAVAAALPSVAVAQQSAQDTTLRRGDIVEVGILDPRSTDKSRQAIRCTATVSEVTTDAVVVKPSNECGFRELRSGAVESIRVRFDAGDRVDHIRAGLLIGLATGGVLGWAVSPHCVLDGPCATQGLKIGTVLGAKIGALVGAAVGAFRDAGDQWRVLGVPPAIRVTAGGETHASLTMRRETSYSITTSIPTPILAHVATRR